MGQIFRKVLIDVFREAQQTGDVPPGFNPAESAKKTAGADIKTATDF